MKKGELSNETFHYREQHRFNENNYILVVRDKESNTNVASILYYKDGKIIDIDEYEMGDKIWTTPNKSMPDALSLSASFLPNQLIKISKYSLNENIGYYENESRPKTKTPWTNLTGLFDNEIIEIFEGTINESEGVFKLKESQFELLIREYYIPTSNCFYIFEGLELIGPFKAYKVDKSGQFLIEKSNFKKFGKYSFEENNYIEFVANDLQRRIFFPSIIEPKLITPSDFVTDIDLIEDFQKQIELHPNNFDSKSLENLIEFIERAQSFTVNNESEKNKNRLYSILQNSKNEILGNLKISQVVPEIAEIKSEIQTLEIEKFNKKNELNNIISQLKELEDRKETLNQEIEGLSKKGEEELNEKKIKLDQNISELELRKNQLDLEIQKDKEAKSTEIKELEATIKYLESKEESLNEGIKTLQEEFTGEQKSTHQKLKDLLVQNQHYNILSGREFSTTINPKDQLIVDFEISTLNFNGPDNKLARYTELKRKIVLILEQNNRKLDSHFIDNVLISIHQNTLTLFAGLPGTGKTSLVRILMNILAPKERIREISVGRGWSSQKDLIGFFNPLSKSFHASSTNLYSLLEQLNWERQENKFLKSPMSYILLDEANLSPMEHYWSTFYNLTDSNCKTDSFLKINLGDTQNIEYANNLRFIGTINYDQTTEELSPRVIDRSNIIRMHPKFFDINQIATNDIKDIQISFEECIEMFELLDFSNINKSFEFDKESEQRFSEIKKKFEELKIFISPRVQISIKRYCRVAKSFMYEENKPLDYCIAQRLLPLIRVQGKNAKNKLEELLDILKQNKFDISTKILEDILQTGAEGEIFQDNFNYFLTLSNV